MANSDIVLHYDTCKNLALTQYRIRPENLSLLNTLKEKYKLEINSPRRYEQISDLESLFNILEKRSALSLVDIHVFEEIYSILKINKGILENYKNLIKGKTSVTNRKRPTDLRIGVIIIIAVRLVALCLIILLGIDVINLGDTPRKDWNGPIPEECYNLYHQRPIELVLLVVTIVLFIIWLCVMIPAVIWEVTSIILIGSVLEILICIWFFFMFSYHLSMAILREHPSFMLLWAVILLCAELYILWIMWSYYVDVKAMYYGYRDSIQTTSTVITL